MSTEEQRQGGEQGPDFGTGGQKRPETTAAGDGGLVGATDVTPGAGGYGGDRSGAPGGAPQRTGGGAGTHAMEADDEEGGEA